MVKLSEISSKETKSITLKCGLTLKIKSNLTVSEQMDLGMAEMVDANATERAAKLPELAFKLIAEWDLTDDKNSPIALDYTIFKTLPISIVEMGKIMVLCSVFDEEDKSKKDDGVS